MLVDYGLPGLHGPEVCRKIGARDPNIPLLLMTGLGGLDVAEREPCVARIISKPFDLFEVLKALQQLIPSV